MAEPYPLAKDGYVARDLSDWAREKLFYIDSYLEIFSVAMRNKWSSLVYADLLAGPGIAVDRQTGEEQPGSALLAINRPAFTRLFLNDVDPKITQALRARIGGEPLERVRIETQDCNTVVDAARDFLFPMGRYSGSLGLAVIDPTAFQMTYEAIGRLTNGLPIDLIIIVMTGFIRRFVALPAYENPLDAFFGTRDWREFVTQRRGGMRITYASMLDLYKEQLGRIGYNYVNEPWRTQMKNSHGATVYHIVFASKHPIGADFFEKISRRTLAGQRRLLI